MGKSPKISIVSTVYNTQPFLEQAVRSILAQTFSDFELLLVDDGSSDDSGSLCDRLAAEDARIRVFHQPNGRPVPATRDWTTPAASTSVLWIPTT